MSSGNGLPCITTHSGSQRTRRLGAQGSYQEVMWFYALSCSSLCKTPHTMQAHFFIWNSVLKGQYVSTLSLKSSLCLEADIIIVMSNAWNHSLVIDFVTELTQKLIDTSQPRIDAVIFNGRTVTSFMQQWSTCTNNIISMLCSIWLCLYWHIFKKYFFLSHHLYECLYVCCFYGSVCVFVGLSAGNE